MPLDASGVFFRTSRARRQLLAGALVASLIALPACSAPTTKAGGNNSQNSSDSSQSPSASPDSSASIDVNINKDGQSVALGRQVKVAVSDGTIESISLTAGDTNSEVTGAMAPDKTAWTSGGRTLPSTSYNLKVVAVDAKGRDTTYESAFKTRALSKAEQTYPSFVPMEGATVGVGMPAIIRFDLPVQNKKAFQDSIQVTTTPAQTGSFKWISDKELHWRPQSYWRPGTKVSINANVGGLPAGGGIYGQLNRTLNFTVGRSMVSKVNMNTHQMKVFRNGKLVRTIPITTGEQPKFTTRSGVKVIIEKHRHKRMNSETIGIDPESADGYDLDDVEYAMRVTYTGEFIHAAPWSVGSQGRANVSHGCTGMSTSNAQWLYENSMIGDVVEYTGTTKQMTLTNGYGDWNETFEQYSQPTA